MLISEKYHLVENKETSAFVVLRIALRTGMLSAVILIMLCSACWSAAAQCESPAMIPLPGAIDGGGTVLYYQRLGIAFVLEDPRWGGIEKVYVFPSVSKTSEMKTDTSTIGADEVVPGQGAFGIKLGSTVSGVQSVSMRKSVWSGSKAKDVPVFAAFYPEDGRSLYAVFDKNMLKELVAEGAFRTPEGITERSSSRDIWKAYGEPEVFWYLNSGSWSPRNIALPVVMFVGGIVAGYLLRVYHRRSRTERQPTALLMPLLLGAVTATVAATIGFWILAGYRIPMVLYPAVAITSFVSGLVLTGIYEAMRGWCTSFLRRIVVLILMILGTVLAVWIVFLLYPKAIVTWSIVWLGIFYSLFSLGLLLSATLRSSNEDHLQQANAG